MKIKYGYRSEDIDLVVAGVKKLPFLHQIAFAASICERLLPNYLIFAQESNWDTYPVLRKALNEIWLIIEAKPIDLTQLNQLLIDCENVIPHHEDNSSGYVVEAIYAASCICHLIDVCMQKEPAALKRIISGTYNTLYQYLDWQMEAAEDMAEEETDDDWSKKTLKEQCLIIANHPFVIREIAKENEDLQRLIKMPILTEEFLQWLRNSFDNQGKSLINIG